MVTRRVPLRQSPLVKTKRRAVRSVPSGLVLSSWKTSHLAELIHQRLLPLQQHHRTQSVTAVLHMGCSRQHPSVDFNDLLDASLSPTKRHTTATRRPSMDPIVAAALEGLSIVGSGGAPAGPRQDALLVLGADATAPISSYRGVAVTADMHYPAYTRQLIQGLLSGSPSGDAMGAPLFDVLVSDAMSPQLELDESQPRLAPTRSPRATDAVTISMGNSIAPSASSLSSSSLAVKGPSRGDRDAYVTDPVLASLAVGLPLLRSTAESVAVVRVSRFDAFNQQATESAVRTLRHRFSTVDFFRDDFGMIALCHGSGGRGDHLLATPYNIREDFPGFQRSTLSERRPRSWDHYRDPLSTKDTFFMAIHPAFDKAPPPDMLAAKLEREKAAEDASDVADEAFMDVVSQSLDTFAEENPK